MRCIASKTSEKNSNPWALFYRKTAIVCAAFSVIFVFGCKRKINSGFDGGMTLESIDSESRDYIRNALAEPQLTTSEGQYVDVASLLSEGSLIQTKANENFSASQSEYSSIIGLVSSARSVNSADNRRMRLDTIRINRPLPPSTLRAANRFFGLQVSLSSQSIVKIYRCFESPAEEQYTPQFGLTDLPLSIENVDKMRVGDLVVLPLEGQMMASVDGSFFRHAYSVGRTLDSFLGSSLIGQAQSGLRANYLISGRFELHISKTGNNHVRVRFFEQNEKALSTNAGVNAAVAAQVRVIPFSKIQQVSEIKKTASIRVSQGDKLGLPAPLARLVGGSVLKGSPQTSLAKAESFDKEMQKRPDGLIEVSARVELSPDQIQNQTVSRVNAIISKLDRQLNFKIRKTSEWIKKYSDQEIRFDAGVSWSEARRGRQLFFADYVFDLKDEAAREAFLQAVSGGAVVLSTRNDAAKFIDPKMPLHNLVLAERLARAQALQGNASVTRLLNLNSQSEISESRFDIHFGRQVSYELSESWQRDRYNLARAGDVNALEGFLTRWSFKQSTLFGLVGEKRERSSGFMSDVMTQKGTQSAYWYAQEVDSRTFGQSHLSQFLIQAHNILGPVAASLGLDKFYSGEAAGRFRGRIVLGFAPALLDRFFDEKLASESQIWRSAAQVSESFDNTFGLPFLVIPAGMPSGIVGSLDEAACQKLATNWGSFYCHYLADEFLPRLRKARAERTAEAKAQFFEAFFSKGFGANKIGSDLLARILLQWAVESQGQLAPEDVVVQLEGRHDGSSAPQFNPRLTYGNSQLTELLRQTLPVW